MDQQITCSDCQTPFTFTEGEQGFYNDKGLKPPRRCKECRAAKKANGGFPSKSVQRRMESQGAHSPQNRMNVGMGSDDAEL